MTKISISDLRYNFKKIERHLMRGEDIQITRRGRVIARLAPEKDQTSAPMPDFLGRLRRIYGEKVFETSGADLIAEDRDRY